MPQVWEPVQVDEGEVREDDGQAAGDGKGGEAVKITRQDELLDELLPPAAHGPMIREAERRHVSTRDLMTDVLVAFTARLMIRETTLHVQTDGDQARAHEEEDELRQRSRELAGTGERRTVEDCPFCDYAGPSEVIRRWHGVFAIEPLRPVVPGHVLVVPEVHVTDVGSAPWVTASVMKAAGDLASKLESANVLTSKGRAATQTVDHLHVHVIPREEGDGIPLPWDRSFESRATRQFVVQRQVNYGGPPEAPWVPVTQPKADLERVRDELEEVLGTKTEFNLAPASYRIGTRRLTDWAPHDGKTFTSEP